MTESLNNDSSNKLEQLTKIGLALSSTEDVGCLLEMIVTSARTITDADGGTLYILEESGGSRQLIFEVLQNRTLAINVRRGVGEAVLPPPIPLYIDGAPNNANVSSYSALHALPVNIEDVYTNNIFNFSGPIKFDALSGYKTTSMLVIPLINHKENVIGVLQLINTIDPESGSIIPFSAKMEEYATALSSQAALALDNAMLIENLSHKIEVISRHQAAEKELNEKLREAFLNTESVNNELTAALKKVSILRNAGFIAAVVLLTLLGMYFGFRGSIPDIISTQTAAGPLKAAQTPPTVILVKRTITATLSISGLFEPKYTVNLINPVPGRVSKIHFNYGERVNAGQLLLQMDTTDLEVYIREAQTAYDKASEKYTEILHWEQGQEVTRMKRALAKARLSLETQQNNFVNTEKLYKRGLVSTVEYETAKQQITSQKMDFQSAEEELAAAINKGNAMNRAIVEREKLNAETTLKKLRNQLSMSKVLSPVTGIVSLPAAGGNAAKIIAVGSPIQEGGLLLSIGDLSGFVVRALVDEINVTKLRVGQSVKVTGEAFPETFLIGVITKVSSESTTERGSGSPSFEIITLIDKVPQNLANRIFVGMSANLEVIIYQNDRALMAPIQAVFTENGKQFIRRKNSHGKWEQTQVTTAHTTAEGVEIVAGAMPGDEIVSVGQ